MLARIPPTERCPFRLSRPAPRLLQEQLIQAASASVKGTFIRERLAIHRVGVEVAAVYGAVQFFRLAPVNAPSPSATQLLQPVENQARQVKGKGRRRVVHGIVISGDLPVEHGRALCIADPAGRA